MANETETWKCLEQETITLGDKVLRVHISKKGDNSPKLILSSGNVDSLGNIHLKTNVTLPTGDKDIEVLTSTIKKLLPKMSKYAPKEEKKVSPSIPSVDSNLEGKLDSILKGISQLGKNQQKLDSRLKKLEGE